MMKNIKEIKQRGFTLIEIMIALAISGVVMTGVYSAFKIQQDSYLAQDQVAETQQNLRAGLFLVAREIRMAGYDPDESANASITVATSSHLAFTKDDNGDGDVTDSNESINFGFSTANDSEPDGIVDDLNGDGNQNDVAVLGRDTGGGFQPIAENIQAIEFFYTLEDGTQTVNPAVLDDIRSVEISVLARAENPDRKFSDNKVYTTGSGVNWGPYNDNYRRRFQVMTVRCRNMGL